MSTPENWLQLDERANAHDNLNMCEHVLCNLPDPIRWKWAIIATHQALYGFALAAVQGTNCNSVRKDPMNPESQVISIWEAIRRAKDTQYLWPGGVPLVTTPEEDRSVDRVVNEFRNGFEHFAPAAWSIEVSGMPMLLGRVLRVVEGIAIGTNSVRYWDDNERAAVVATIWRLKQLLTAEGVAA